MVEHFMSIDIAKCNLNNQFLSTSKILKCLFEMTNIQRYGILVTSCYTKCNAMPSLREFFSVTALHPFYSMFLDIWIYTIDLGMNVWM